MVAVAKVVARALIPRRLRNWLRRPASSFRWLRDQVAHFRGRDQVVQVRPGWEVRCHPAAWRLAYRVHLEDPEQVPELDAFIAACTPGMVFLDLGAHFGLFSLAALHFGGPGARAMAVDPSPTAERMLHCQARLNGVERRLEVVRAAVSASDGQTELVSAGVGSAGYFVPPERQHARGERTVVRAVTIDSLVLRGDLRPTHVKLDVEGGEADALRGGVKTLAAGAAPVLFVELHNAIVAGRGGDPGESLAILREMGYATFRLDGAAVTSEEILEHAVARVVARRMR